MRALILEPKRELAAQVETAIHDYGRFTNLRTTVLFSGTGYGRQDQALNGFRNVRYEVMVATDIAARGIDIEQISHVITSTCRTTPRTPPRLAGPVCLLNLKKSNVGVEFCRLRRT